MTDTERLVLWVSHTAGPGPIYRQDLVVFPYSLLLLLDDCRQAPKEVVDRIMIGEILGDVGINDDNIAKALMIHAFDRQKRHVLRKKGDNLSLPSNYVAIFLTSTASFSPSEFNSAFKLDN